jgi:hypothetical protein
MDFAERLVSLAYQSLGYFVMEGVPAGRNEADLLAIKLDNAGDMLERLHIEVQVSTNPIGVLRKGASLGDAASRPMEAAGEYIAKKFETPKQTVVQKLGSSDYRKVFVHGEIRDECQLAAFENEDIECRKVQDLIAEARSEAPVAEFRRQLETAELLTKALGGH